MMDEETVDLKVRVAVLEEKAAQHDRQLQSNQTTISIIVAAISAAIALLALAGVHI